MRAAAECFSDAAVISFLIVQVVVAALLFGAGYWAGSADSRRLGSPRQDADAIPDPRRFKPPNR